MRVLKNRLLFVIIMIYVAISTTPASGLSVYTQDAFMQLNESAKTAEGDDCIVKFLTDNKGQMFVLKQVKDPSIEEQVKLVFEYVAAEIATQANIPIPKTYIIPKEWLHVAKKYPDRVAILQMMVPGNDLEEHTNFTVQQQSRGPYTEVAMTARFGKLPEENRGLTLNVIKSMSQHDDLCKIIAFDTFINNSDRSRPNIFYENKTNRYYGIDHLAAFTNKSLSKHALRQISNHSNTLTPLDLSILKKYLSILQILYKTNPPATVISQINIQIKRFFPEDSKNPKVIDMLSGYESFIVKNYADTKLLIDYTAKLTH